MSKTKKVLSIILITLLILSTVFTLMKKVGLCASSDNNPVGFDSIPLPAFNGEGLSTSINLTDSVIAEIWDIMDNNSSNGVPQYILIDEVTDSDNFSVIVLNSFNNGVCRWRYSDTNGFPGSAIFEGHYCYFRIVNGHYANYSAYGDNLTLILSNFLDSDLNGYYLLKSGTLNKYPIWRSGSGDIVDYTDNDVVIFTSSSNSGGSDSPGFNHYFWQNYQDSIDDLDNYNNIWKPNYQNPSNQQGFWDNVTDFFNRSFKSLLGGISGGVKTIGDYIEQFYNNCTEFWTRCWDTLFGWLSGLKDNTDDISDDTSDISGTVSSIDSRLSSFFGSFWGNLDDHLEDFVQGIWGDLPDIIKSPYRIAQWFYQHGLKNGEFDFLTLWQYLFDFDSQTAYNLWSSNKYGDFILDVRDFFSNLISSITGVTASDRVFFTISLGNHFGVNIPDIEIDFSWYASIRDQFLPYLMAFLYVSVLWLFFKRLPDILKGVAGAESSFTDSLPYDTHSTTYIGEGIFTSNTHVSNGGRTRVTRNSYKKL